nr:cytochrome c [Thermus caldilimi]
METAPAGGTQGAAPAPGAAPASQAISPQEAATLAKEGEGLYAQHCAACHQANGQGVPGAFPPLAGNPNLQDKTYHIQVVLNGLQNKPITVNGQTYQGAMPAFGQLSDREIAAILTYERTAWGNNLGPVSEAEVKAAR